MARALVTGGAGFIGSHIADRLLADGFEVHVLDDLSSGSRTHVAERATLHHLDIRSAETLALTRRLAPEVIVHAAAQISVRRSMEDPRFDADVNVVGLVNLLHGIPAPSRTHLVFLSTGGALYGEQTQFPAPESHALEPKSIYGLAKRVGELYLEFWSREHGLRVTALRLANIYGPRQNPHGEAGVVAIFNERLLSGQSCVINGTGKQTRDFVYVGDVAEAAGRVVKGSVQGTFNVGTGVETSVNELYQAIAREAGFSCSAEYAPAKAGEQMRSCIDSAALERAIGWRPRTSFSEGTALTSAWFKQKMGR